MPVVSHRSPMLPQPARRNLAPYLAVFFLLFAAPLFFIHLPLLSLPYFWDEQGQFIPTALDILRHGWWVAHSTLPNVHPPGVEAYLVCWYKAFGYSIPVTRIAMLSLAAAGVLLTFLLAIELSRGTRGTPAFWPPLFLLASPLFYTQSMMAQLDMPAMAFTLLALLLFLKRRYALTTAACVLLVLSKETGLVTPFVFFLLLVVRRQWRPAALFIIPAAALAAWLTVLHHATGYWLGNPGFAHYNVEYSLHPVRMTFSFLRRFYYLFIAEFRWVASLLILFTARSIPAFRSEAWRVTIWVAAANVVLVSALGGAELERYLLPVLPLFYAAVAVALTAVPQRLALALGAVLTVGLAANLFWNPPYPFPYENNYAMVDFVELERVAAGFLEDRFANATIATAWPYTASLSSPDYGYVERKLKTFETNDFHYSSIASVPAAKFDVLVTYTREWDTRKGVTSWDIGQRFLRRFYQWEPSITSAQCAQLGLTELVSWTRRGQRITIYARRPSPAFL